VLDAEQKQILHSMMWKELGRTTKNSENAKRRRAAEKDSKQPTPYKKTKLTSFASSHIHSPSPFTTLPLGLITVPDTSGSSSRSHSEQDIDISDAFPGQPNDEVPVA
jgi:hypothetical protein